MGGGASAPLPEDIPLVLEELKYTPLSTLIDKSSDPVLIQGRAVPRSGDSVFTAPLGKCSCLYYRSSCDQYKVGNYERKVLDERRMNFDLVDVNNPNIKIQVPFQSTNFHFKLERHQKDMASAASLPDLEDTQRQFLSAHKFEPTVYTTSGKVMKKLVFTEYHVEVNQIISIICCVKNNIAQPVQHKHVAANWNDRKKKAWNSIFGNGAIVLTDEHEPQTVPVIQQQLAPQPVMMQQQVPVTHQQPMMVQQPMQMQGQMQPVAMQPAPMQQQMQPVAIQQQMQPVAMQQQMRPVGMQMQPAPMQMQPAAMQQQMQPVGMQQQMQPVGMQQQMQPVAMQQQMQPMGMQPVAMQQQMQPIALQQPMMVQQPVMQQRPM